MEDPPKNLGGPLPDCVGEGRGVLLWLLQRQPGESCGEIWGAVLGGGQFGGEGRGRGALRGSLGVREGAGGFGGHLNAAQLRVLPAK